MPSQVESLRADSEKSDSLSNSQNSEKVKKPGLPPMPGATPGVQSHSRALPPLAKKNNNGPLFAKPEQPVPQVKVPAPAYAYVQKPASREGSRDKLRANSREREREYLIQARQADVANHRDGNMRDRYRAPSAGKAGKVNAKPVWWGN